MAAAALVGISMALIPSELWMEFSRNRILESGQEIPAGFEAGATDIRIASAAGAVILTPVMMAVMAGGVSRVDPGRSFGFAVAILLAIAMAFALVAGALAG